MYINGILLGVLATIFVEMALFIIVVIVYAMKNNKHNKSKRV